MNMIGNGKVWLARFCMCGIIVGGTAISVSGLKEPLQKSLPLEKVANYLHSIIEADRTVYPTHVVNRLQGKGEVSADEHWEQNNALPLPAQFIQRAGRLVAEHNCGIRYRLISLWPICRRNGPATDFEREG